MLTPRTIIPALLIGGLVAIEVLAGNNQAQSQHQLSPEETGLILSILHGDNSQTTDASNLMTIPFLELNLPDSPSQVTNDAQLSYGTIIGRPYPTTIPSQTAPDAGSLLAELLPPLATPLYYAYQDGGRAWYGQGHNVLVIFPDETIQSFNTETGTQTDWLQDKLAHLPVADPSAYQTYQTDYHAQIVAETTSWVLMEFPSGGVLKVKKPQYSPLPPPTGGNIMGLPDILPGYSQ